MGKSSPSAPAAPDPVATANAQSASNVETARTTAALNRVNQVTPYGTINYTQDPNNQDSWTQTTTLSPSEQQNLNNTQQAQGIYGNTAVRQLGSVQDTLAQPFQSTAPGITDWANHESMSALQRASAANSQPVNTDYNAIRQQAIDAANSRLLPEQKMQEETLRSRLLNSGITEGSDAWNNAYRQFNNSNNDAQQQSILNAENLAGQSISQTAALRQIPIQEAGQIANTAGSIGNQAGAGLQQSLAVRDQPLNEAASLLTGQQVQAPTMNNIPQTQVAPTDVTGATLGSANLANQQYQSKVAQQSAQTGGMYGLLGTLGGAGMLAFSDERMKKDKHKVGKTPAGANVYSFRYKGDPTGKPRIGVMAQELLKKQPGAVTKTPSGMYAVDYARVR